MKVKYSRENSVPGRTQGSVKADLIAKFRTSFVDRLSKKDLGDLQFFLRHSFGKDRTIKTEYFTKFTFMLRQYFHEETLTRDMASIEALVELLKPEDLRE